MSCSCSRFFPAPAARRLPRGLLNPNFLFERIFPGLTRQELPDGEGRAIETVELITHNGTHLDAPYHFASTVNHGERAITIDEVPLEWFQPGVKLDFRHFPDWYVVRASDVEAELQRIRHELKPLELKFPDMIKTDT